jgi:hypothetical protein
METFDSGGGWSPKPSVSRDKWLEHARKKLTAGYVLIVNTTRSSANFYKAGAGYEACAYRVALSLIQSGMVVESGDHDLGMKYRLSESAFPPADEHPGHRDG